MKFLAAAALIAVATSATAPAQAGFINWVQWNPTFTTGSTNGTVTGTAFGGLPITYTGEVENVLFGYPSWTPTATFDGGTGTPPSPAGGMIALFGGQGATNTISFGSAVWDLYIAIWSLGSPNAPAQFDFNSSFILDASGGQSSEYGGMPLGVSGNVVFGAEGNGVVLLPGSHWSISWTNPDFENYYGFTIGFAGETACPGPPPGEIAAADCRPPMPEPLTLVLFGSGLAALAILPRRRRCGC